jgi:alpha-ketoglutarate-dependent taurine dioxygenase
MLTATQSWRADTIDEQPAWYASLPRQMLEALDGLLRNPPEDLTSAILPEALLPLCREAVRPIAEALERGRGFVVVKPPARYYHDHQLKLLYWLVGQALGRPVVQNVQGALLYDVRDTGQDVRYGARFSVTNAESSFHTDASFFDEITDYVGLLCLRPARSGGISQLASGGAVYEELLTRAPDALAVLSRPFHVDRRGGARPGESATARFPVVNRPGSGLVYRYLRYWIEAGHDRANEPLTPEQRQALDTLDGILADPTFRIEFMLQPGEVFFFNNRWLLHNRTAFEDFDEPERRRHLVRLWLAQPR